MSRGYVCNNLVFPGTHHCGECVADVKLHKDCIVASCDPLVIHMSAASLQKPHTQTTCSCRMYGLEGSPTKP